MVFRWNPNTGIRNTKFKLIIFQFAVEIYTSLIGEFQCIAYQVGKNLGNLVLSVKINESILCKPDSQSRSIRFSYDFGKN